MPPSTPRPPANPRIVPSGLTKGLAFAWIPTSGRAGQAGRGVAVDLVTGKIANFNTATVGSAGAVHIVQNTGGASFSRLDLKFDQPFTVFSFFRPHTLAGAGAICGNRSGNYGWEHHFNSSNLASFRMGSGGTLSAYAGKTLGTQSWVSMAHTVEPTGSTKHTKAYFNGTLSSTATISSDVAYTTTATDTFIIAGGSSSGGAMAQVAAVFVWNRILSPAEIRALDADPYLFFRENEQDFGLIFTSSESTFENFAEVSRSGGIRTWTDESNAQLDDGSYAYTDGLTPIGAFDEWTHYLEATELTTPPAADAVLLGIEVDVSAFIDNDAIATVPQLDAQLTLGGTPIGDVQVLTESLTETETIYTFGSSSDLWNATITAEDLAESDFGVLVSFRVDNDPENILPTINIDQIKARFTYLSSSAAPQSWTGSGTGAFAIGGTCAALVSKAGAATGGVVTGGSAYGPITFGAAVSPGGVVFSGNLLFGVTASATGSFVISGSSSGQLITYWVQGGLVVVGTAASNQEVFAPQIIGELAFAGTGGTPKLTARGSTLPSGIVVAGSVSGNRTTRGSAIGHFEGSGGVSGVVSGLMALGSGGAVISGAVAGLLSKQGSASGAFTISGSSSGVSHLQTGAAGMFAMSGTITGSAVMRSGASGGIVVSGSAKSVNRAFAGAIGSLTFSGQVTPVVSLRGSVSGGFALAGSVNGHRHVVGSILPSHKFPPEEFNNIFKVNVLRVEIGGEGDYINLPVLAGGQVRKGFLPGPGGVVMGGSAAGQRNQFGLIYGGITVSGTSAGHIVRVGVATGSITISGNVNGLVSRYGAVLAGITVAGTIVGLTTRRGAAIGRFALGGSVIFPLIEFDGATAWSLDCDLQQIITVALAHVIDVNLTTSDASSID